MAWEFLNTLWGPDIVNTAPKCVEPGCNAYADNAGNSRYHKYCSMHHKRKYLMNGWSYKQHRKDFCENQDGRLGFVCDCTIREHMLTVDHIDGDHNNDDMENLQTLCWNCHRWKTMVNEENLPMHKRKKFLEELHKEQLTEVGYFNRSCT